MLLIRKDSHCLRQYFPSLATRLLGISFPNKQDRASPGPTTGDALACQIGRCCMDHNHLQELGSGPLSPQSSPNITSPSTSTGYPSLRDKVLVTAGGGGYVWNSGLHIGRGVTALHPEYIKLRPGWGGTDGRNRSGTASLVSPAALSFTSGGGTWFCAAIPAGFPPKFIVIRGISGQRALEHWLELYPLQPEHSTPFTQSFLFKHSFRQLFFQRCFFAITLLSRSLFPCST